MIKLKRMAAAALSALMLATAAGCSGGSGPASTTAPPERPQVTAAPDKVAPPEAVDFTGYSLKIKPAQGREVILQEPVAAQLIMGAFSSGRLRVADAKGKFNNKIDLVDPDGKSKYSFALTSDGQTLLKYAGDGRVFRMPEYVYYLIENNLWTYGGSLMDTQIKWKAGTDIMALELQLPRLIKSAMFPAFGYAMAYFTTYKIYGVNTATRNVAKVYLLITYAGYDIYGENFSPSFLYTTPVTLIFAKTGSDMWKLTELKQPPKAKTKKDLYTSVRTIFPYDYMEDVLADLSDADLQTKDIVSLATEYLNEVGLSGLNVQS
jgi:hypothetical protein